MLDCLKKFFIPVTTFNDLSYKWEFFSLKFENFGAIDLMASVIQ